MVIAIVGYAYIYYDDLMKAKYNSLLFLYICRVNKAVFKIVLQ